MQSEIYQIKIPDFFVGMTYRKFGQILYFHSMTLEADTNTEKFIWAEHVKINNAITLIAIETIADPNFVSMHDDASSVGSSPLLIHSRSESKTAIHKSHKVFPVLDESPITSHKPKILNHYMANQQIPSSPSNSTKGKEYRTEILINPQDYNIKKNDTAYVLCNDHYLAKSIEKIDSTKS